MGRFSGSSSVFEENVQEIDVPVIENFDYSAGTYLRLIAETAINERISFDDSMQKEFNELATIIKKESLMTEGAVEEAAKIEVVSEGVQEVLGKLSSMATRAWAKIKSWYEAIKNKITALLVRDYNGYYKKNITIFNANVKTFKGKFNFSVPTKKLSLSSLKYQGFAGMANQTLNSIISANADRVKEIETEVSEGTLLSKLLGDSVGKGSVTTGSYKEEIHSYLFNESTEHESVSGEIAKVVTETLGTKNIIGALNEAQKANSDFFKKLISEIKSATSKIKGTDGDTTVNVSSASFSAKSRESEKKDDVNRLNVFTKVVKVNQNANSIINGNYISLIKHHISECKALFVRVVNTKVAKNEQVLLDAVSESAYNEFMDTMDSLEVVSEQ